MELNLNLLVLFITLVVHHSDSLRLDIVIPGEQHIYVRAASSTERQQWLVALGSAKAQGLMARSKRAAGIDELVLF